MMGHKQVLKRGDEVDAVSPWRRVHNFRAGDRRKVKRMLNKRERAEARQALRDRKRLNS
jgi:hypothetical protein